MKKICIGLFGFGVVGGGIYHVLTRKPRLNAYIKKVVIKHPEKKRDAPAPLFTADADEVLEDNDIDLVVELIDDAEAALQIVLKAFEKGKSVISANKRMIAENLEYLVQKATENKVSFLYEAAVCGSVPVIRNLEEYFDSQLITHVTGIVNGSTNFIITQMAKFNLDFSAALAKAQELGFAESDPSLDVNGWDARNKLKIIALHAFGTLIPDEDIAVLGIQYVSSFDMQYAREKDYVIKLLASCRVDEQGEIAEVSVLPTFIPKRHSLRLTDNEFNGVLIGGQLADEQFFYGKGAGRYPTASAVLSDISAYKYDYKYEYKKGMQKPQHVASNEGRFYISYPKGKRVDFSQLGKVHEWYENGEMCYLILEGSLQKILPYVQSQEFSFIRMVD